jgi:hypothetical protein
MRKDKMQNFPAAVYTEDWNHYMTPAKRIIKNDK